MLNLELSFFRDSTYLYILLDAEYFSSLGEMLSKLSRLLMCLYLRLILNSLQINPSNVDRACWTFHLIFKILQTFTLNRFHGIPKKKRIKNATQDIWRNSVHSTILIGRLKYAKVYHYEPLTRSLKKERTLSESMSVDSTALNGRKGKADYQNLIIFFNVPPTSIFRFFLLVFINM